MELWKLNQNQRNWRILAQSMEGWKNNRFNWKRIDDHLAGFAIGFFAGVVAAIFFLAKFADAGKAGF